MLITPAYTHNNNMCTFSKLSIRLTWLRHADVAVLLEAEVVVPFASIPASGGVHQDTVTVL